MQEGRVQDGKDIITFKARKGLPKGLGGEVETGGMPVSDLEFGRKVYCSCENRSRG